MVRRLNVKWAEGIRSSFDKPNPTACIVIDGDRSESREPHLCFEVFTAFARQEFCFGHIMSHANLLPKYYDHGGIWDAVL